MPARSPALVALALLLLQPLAAAHEGEHEPSDPEPAPETVEEVRRPAALRGYTGPGREPYFNYFEGAWMYGRLTATPLEGQYPRDMRGSGEWLVWEDAYSRDIYAHNVAAGSGFYLTRDAAIQQKPRIDGNVVVWEEYKDTRGADIVAYFLDTGEMRLLSKTPGNNRNPSVRDGLVAWENDRNKTLDIYAYDVQNATEFPLVLGEDRQSDPLVLHGLVYYRAYRFNIWDLFVVDPKTGISTQLTSDIAMQAAPFTNGEDVYFNSQYFTAWALDKYDVDTGRLSRTRLKFQDVTPPAASGDRILQVARDLTFRQLVARNLTSGESMHVTGDLLLTTDPWLDDDTAYVSIPTKSGVSLLTLKISPFAWVAKPEIVLTTPRSGASWGGPLTVQGILRLPGDWAEPTTFTYRVDGEAPVALAPEDRFRFSLDPEDREQGRHILVVRATFRDGPPIEANLLLLVPSSAQRGIDVEAAGEYYHDAVIQGILRQYVYENPASFVLIVLVILVLIVLAIRLYVVLRPVRRAKVEIEYVAPDESGS